MHSFVFDANRATLEPSCLELLLDRPLRTVYNIVMLSFMKRQKKIYR